MMEDILLKKGLKQTKSRLLILDILDKADKPLTAEEIYRLIQNEEDSINLSTVYRTLEVFLNKNIVQIPLMKDGNKASYILNRDEHHHYLVCDKCHKMIKIDFCPFAEFEKQIEQLTSFTILKHKLELFGICPNCQGKTK